jgi:hypothetical protein
MAVHVLWSLTTYGVIKQNSTSEISYSKTSRDLLEKIGIRKKEKENLSALGCVETRFFISLI